MNVAHMCMVHMHACMYESKKMDGGGSLKFTFIFYSKFPSEIVVMLLTYTQVLSLNLSQDSGYLAQGFSLFSSLPP
jgi:hypothetical protein